MFLSLYNTLKRYIQCRFFSYFQNKKLLPEIKRAADENNNLKLRLLVKGEELICENRPQMKQTASSMDALIQVMEEL